MMHQRINPYIGIPYKERGCSMDGVYCVGFVCLWYKRELGIDIPDPATQNPLDVRNSPFCDSFRRIPNGAGQFSDMVITDGWEGPDTHMGIFTPMGLLHASRESGVLLQPWPRIDIKSVYRVKIYD